MERLAVSDASVHELIRRRRSPRAFSDRSVGSEELLSVLEAARWAPSSYNAQPWAFLVATKEDPKNFARMLGVLVEGNRIWAQRAPVLLLSVARQNFEHNGQPNRHAWHDVGLATANLMVQATALGLATHAMAGFDAERARAEFGIPEGWEPVAVIALGYPGAANLLSEPLRERELAPRLRKPVEEFVFGGRWGEPCATPARELAY